MEPTRCREDEELDAYVNRLELTISQDLAVSVTPFTAKDKVQTNSQLYRVSSLTIHFAQDELVKRKRFEAQPPRAVQRPSSRWQAMASQVKEVLPHVPMAVILSDLSKHLLTNVLNHKTTL